jgi:hypothetical protein
VLFSTGNASVGSITCDEPFRLTGDTLSVDSTSVFTRPFTLESGGTLAGRGKVSFTGNLVWSGGTMTGTGTTAINDTLLVTSGDAKQLRGGRTLENASITIWSGSGDIEHGEGELGTRIDNIVCGTFLVPGTRVLSHIGGAGNPATCELCSTTPPLRRGGSMSPGRGRMTAAGGRLQGSTSTVCKRGLSRRHGVW